MPRQPETPDPKTTTATKTVSPAVLAARAFNRIEALIKQRDDELARAPESIAERYAEKIRIQRLPLGVTARELLDGMLEKAGYAEPKVSE